MQFFALELVHLFGLLIRFLLHQIEFVLEWLIVLEEELLNTTGFKRQMSFSASWQVERLINLEVCTTEELLEEGVGSFELKQKSSSDRSDDNLKSSRTARLKEDASGGMVSLSSSTVKKSLISQGLFALFSDTETSEENVSSSTLTRGDP